MNHIVIRRGSLSDKRGLRERHDPGRRRKISHNNAPMGPSGAVPAREVRVLTLHKNVSCLFQTFGRERSCVIEQEPFCGVRTHFYHDASSYDMFRDRRVVESHLTRPTCGQTTDPLERCLADHLVLLLLRSQSAVTRAYHRKTDNVHGS